MISTIIHMTRICVVSKDITAKQLHLHLILQVNNSLFPEHKMICNDLEHLTTMIET